MSKYIVDSSLMTGIADNIRLKTGEEGNLVFPTGFNAAIESLPSIEDMRDIKDKVDDIKDILDSNGSEIDKTITTLVDIASFSDGADDIPMALKVDVEPVQDLHGYDNPWPGGGGVNIWDEEYIYQSDRIQSKNYIPASPETTYYRKSPNNIIPFYYDSTYTQIGTGIWGTGNFTTPANTSFIKFQVDPAYGNTYKNDISINYPATETAYYPYSNICPISGWTGCNVTRMGKNLFSANNELTKNIYRANLKPINGDDNACYLSGAGGANDNQMLTVAAWANIKKMYNIVFKEDTVVTFSCKVKNYTDLGSRTGIVALDYKDENDYFSDAVRVGDVRFSDIGVTQVSITGTIPAGKFLVLNMSPVSSPESVILSQYTEVYDMQLEIGSLKTEFEPYQSSTYSIAFPSSAGTVYGGELTINQDGSGTLVVDMVNVDLGTLAWTKEGNHFYSEVISSAKSSTSNTVPSNIISSNYKNIGAYYVTQETTNCTIGLNNSKRLYIYDTAYTDAETFKTAMSGVQLVYELATPVTYELSNLEVIETLKGINNVWADTGKINEVEYSADSQLCITNKLNELNSLLSIYTETQE